LILVNVRHGDENNYLNRPGVPFATVSAAFSMLGEGLMMLNDVKLRKASKPKRISLCTLMASTAATVVIGWMRFDRTPK
jgi:hypothetical protein